MSNCEYVTQYYKVPACIGRRIAHNGRSGIIAKDRGHYIGVNFDDCKPGVISNVHPTDNVVYLDMGEIRKMTKAQERYQRYLEYGEGFNSFIEYCKWDADPDRTWNGGIDHEALINSTLCDSSGCY